MRKGAIAGLSALLLATGGIASAQQDVASKPVSIDFGLRFTDVSGDQARFQRFRDLGDGVYLERFRLDREGRNWFFKSGADHVGRRDQGYWAEYGGSGKVKIRFQWDQVPLSISQDTRTLYTQQSPGVFRLADDIRQGIESGQLRLSDVTGRAADFDVRSRRDTAQFNVISSPTHDVDVKVNVKTAHREGTMPWGASFGFNNDIEVPAPVDTRTTDLSAGVEWANARGMLRVGYDGSWFDNDIPTLVWDSPWKFTDLPAGSLPAQGRTALWPNSTTQSVNTAGSLKLPVRSRLTANVSVGRWNQNDPLLPYTINSAVPVVPLERATAEAEARTLAMNYNFTSRPSRFVWLNARYRYYDFDNRTPLFHAEGFVLLDQRRSGGHHSVPLSSTRHNVDLDASFTPVPFTALRVGYGREQVDRTFRIFARTTDDVLRASIDATGTGWLTLRAIFERSTRRGRFDEEALVELVEHGEQPAMRHFDIADRDRNRATALVQLMPIPSFGISASAAAGNDDYKNSGFGLRDNGNRTYTISVDWTPVESVAADLSYARETYAAFQRSRNAAPGAQFVDPTRDWSIDSTDRVHTVTADLDLLKLLPRTELRFAYSFTRSRAVYTYGVPPNSTLAVPQQLPPVLNALHTGIGDFRYFLTARLAASLMYTYDRYRVDDFALGLSTIDRIDLPGSLFLGAVYRPYTANAMWVRLMYFW